MLTRSRCASSRALRWRENPSLRLARQIKANQTSFEPSLSHSPTEHAMTTAPLTLFGRRQATALLIAAAAVTPTFSFAADADTAAIQREIAQHHDEAVKRLQDWIALPSIAAENRNSREGAEYMAKLAR